MSIATMIEQEFQAIVADARSVPEKLAALVGLHTKSETLTALEPQLIAIVENGQPTNEKVSAILSVVGKL